jgi:hypothetical protein
VLNYGDCLAYGVAMAAGEPLLFKGDDFPRTDVVAAVLLRREACASTRGDGGQPSAPYLRRTAQRRSAAPSR